MSAPSVRKPVVLLVEDEELVRVTTSTILIDESYGVVAARNGDHALAVLNVRDDIRLMITNVEMPGSVDGFALARIVDVRWPGIGIVVTSVRTAPRHGDLPRKVRFLAMPYSAAALTDAVQAALDPAAKPMRVYRQERVRPPGPMLPVGVAADQLQPGPGQTRSLVQPLPEAGE